MSSLNLAGVSPAEQPDPDLTALPGPPRRAKAMTVTALTLGAIAALAVTVGLRREVSYALVGESGAIADLGDLQSASEGSLSAHENRPVRADGLLGVTGGIRYERPFVDDSFRALPVAGRQTPFDLWVEVRVPSGQEGGQEDGRWQPPGAFAGRLLRLDASGPRHRGLKEAIEQATHEHVRDGAWLLVDGERPADARWSIVVSAMFLAFAAWNMTAIGRIVRKIGS